MPEDYQKEQELEELKSTVEHLQNENDELKTKIQIRDDTIQGLLKTLMEDQKFKKLLGQKLNEQEKELKRLRNCVVRDANIIIELKKRFTESEEIRQEYGDLCLSIHEELEKVGYSSIEKLLEEFENATK